jgi:hypothetical protein
METLKFVELTNDFFFNYHGEFHNKATNPNYLIVFDNVNLRLNYVQHKEEVHNAIIFYYI